MMSRSVTLALVLLVYLSVQSALAYENVYDLLERRSQRFRSGDVDPRYFQSTTFYDDGNRFFTGQNQNYRLVYPTGNPYNSKFGNGYDNLGNGIPTGYFHPFRQKLIGDWRFERRPYREQTFKHFHGYPNLRKPHHEYAGHVSGGYYPAVHEAPGAVYGDEYSGHKDFTQVDRFVEDNEDKKQRKMDEYYQRTQEGMNLDSLKKERVGEQLHADQIGENKSSLRSNKVVKKGRTTKGFAVHHHKDETGNSTTFFDETSDFGGQSDLRDISDEFGTRRTLEQLMHKGDEKYYKEKEGQTVNHDRGLLTGNQRFEKDFSSTLGHGESANKFYRRNENDPGLKKTYQYLNGEKFEYSEPQADGYY